MLRTEEEANEHEAVRSMLHPERAWRTLMMQYVVSIHRFALSPTKGRLVPPLSDVLPLHSTASDRDRRLWSADLH